ncbi:hypothetical protein ACHAXT_006147 [Thalassiosira profunda]
MDAGAMADSNLTPDFASCSVESLLGVPTRFIFRETQTQQAERGRRSATHQKKYIFSKSEVSTLLRVSMLSSEMDALLSLVYDALDRTQKCAAYQKRIVEANKGASASIANGVHLRALLPLLAVHSQTAEEAVKHASSEEFGIGRALAELEACANDLGKFAEQNHNMADQLEGYTGQDNTLSEEKRAIAEIEEEIVKRIESLGLLAAGTPSTAVTEEGSQNSTDSGEKPFTSMGDLCESLFSGERPLAPARPVEKGDYTESQFCGAEGLMSLGRRS